jgi:replicative DNA helicase
MGEMAQLPHSLEAERAVLAGLMLGAYSYSSVTQSLEVDDFYRSSHGQLYGLILQMLKDNEPIELASVAEKLLEVGLEEEVGGLGYVNGLLNQTASTHNIDYYASIVINRATRRRLLKNIQEVAEKALKGGSTLPELLDFAEGKLFEVTKNSSQKDWQVIRTVVDSEFQLIQKLMLDSSEVTGISTGFFEFDKKLAGLQRTDMVVLAARPGMGKTALALNIALNAAKNGDGVGLFSLEMSAGQLVRRLLCVESRVDANHVRKGTISKDIELPRLLQASNTLFDLPIYLDDSPGLNIMQVRSKARRLVSANPEVGLIIIDYIGLMGGDATVNRQEQVSSSSRGLKAMAKELNVCVMVLSQLNRSVEQRTDKRPVPSDLRESGAIEQDADVITFIYRDEYYNEDSADVGVAEVIIAKQRNGPTGTVRLAFQGKYTRFDNLAENEGGYL